MEILELHLSNFRNFSSKKFVFDRNLTVIIGANGAGKSNILEAIGLISAVKSDKAQTDSDLVKFGKSEAKIEGSAKQNFLFVELYRLEVRRKVGLKMEVLILLCRKIYNFYKRLAPELMSG